MILRKPWLYLIRHFKLIHLLLLGLMIYTILKTNNIYQFFSEYTEKLRYAYSFNLTNEYFSDWFLFIVFVIVGIVSLLIILFKVKKKPWFLYLMILINYVFLMILLTLGYNLFESMEIVVPDIRYVSLIKDLFFVSLGIQYVVAFFTSTRALGFDVKKFNFAKDISELKATSKDNEEFEVDVKFNADNLKKKFNYFKRELKAIIIEQKYIIILISIVVAIWIGIAIYIDTSITNRIYGLNDTVRIDRYER